MMFNFTIHALNIASGYVFGIFILTHESIRRFQLSLSVLHILKELRESLGNNIFMTLILSVYLLRITCILFTSLDLT